MNGVNFWNFKQIAAKILELKKIKNQNIIKFYSLHSSISENNDSNKKADRMRTRIYPFFFSLTAAYSTICLFSELVTYPNFIFDPCFITVVH